MRQPSPLTFLIEARFFPEAKGKEGERRGNKEAGEPSPCFLPLLPAFLEESARQRIILFQYFTAEVIFITGGAPWK